MALRRLPRHASKLDEAYTKLAAEMKKWEEEAEKG